SVRKSVDEHFAGIAAGPPVTRAYPTEPPQTAPREATLTLEVALPVVVGGYHIPAARDADIPALQVLATILSAGESSRMHRRLVRQDQLAVAAGGFAEAMEDSGLFLVYAVHLPDRDQAQIRKVLLGEIERVRSKLVDGAELAKAKHQLTAAYVFGLESVEGVARELGLAELIEGDWRRFLDASERYDRVTAEDVKRVAAKYLLDNNLTFVTLKPAPPKTATGGGAP
ncbi:MAG TPA: insulinase family protein, partial [Polyangia bacterium]|nr:insulinase family protein [Polyangia bacterium]